MDDSQHPFLSYCPHCGQVTDRGYYCRDCLNILEQIQKKLVKKGVTVNLVDLVLLAHTFSDRKQKQDEKGTQHEHHKED